MPYKYTPSHTVNQLIGVVGDVVRGDTGTLNLLKIPVLPFLLLYGAGRDLGLWGQDETLYERFGESFDDLYTVISGFTREQLSKSELKYQINEYENTLPSLNADFLEKVTLARREINALRKRLLKEKKTFSAKFLATTFTNTKFKNLFAITDELLKNYMIFITFLIIIKTRMESKGHNDFLRKMHNTKNEYAAFFEAASFIDNTNKNSIFKNKYLSLLLELGKIVQDENDITKPGFTYDTSREKHGAYPNPYVIEDERLSSKEAARVKSLFKKNDLTQGDIFESYKQFKRTIAVSEAARMMDDPSKLAGALGCLQEFVGFDADPETNQRAKPGIFQRLLKEFSIPSMQYAESSTKDISLYITGELKKFTNKKLFNQLNKNEIHEFIENLTGFTLSMLFSQGMFLTSICAILEVMNA